MNYFEYIIDVPVTEEVETKTNSIIGMIKQGNVPFNLYKIIDEGENEKKHRTFIITSLYNIHNIISQLFIGTSPIYQCYYKSRVSM